MRTGGKVVAHQPVARSPGVPVTVAPELQALANRSIPDSGRMAATA